MSTKVYKFRLYAPILNGDLVEEQLKLANAYRNKLIELERDRRVVARELNAERRSVLGEYIDAAEELKTRLKREVNRLKAMKAMKARGARKSPELKDQEKLVTQIRQERKAAVEDLKAREANLKTTSELQAKYDKLWEDLTNKTKEERNLNGLYWGTGGFQEQAMQKSSETLHLGKDPRFKRWDGCGTVAVQVQKPLQMPLKDFFHGKSTLINFIMDDEGASGTKRHGVVQLRVGSDRKKPIWAEWPLVMHREMHERAVITGAQIHKTRTADKFKYHLCVTAKLPDDVRKERCGDGVVALDIGWRKLLDGNLRVAYWKDREGNGGQLVLDPAVLSGLGKDASLQAICRGLLNKLYKAFYTWLSSVANLPENFQQIYEEMTAEKAYWKEFRALQKIVREARAGGLPELDALEEKLAEMKARQKEVRTWKVQGKFSGLLEDWRNNRWDGDNAGFTMLDDWWRGTYNPESGHREGGCKHLWQWRSNQREKSQRRRKHQYRNLGAEFSRKAGVLVLENFDLTDMQRDAEPEEKKKNPEAKLNQRYAACYELREAFIQAFQSRGGRVVKIDPQMTTQICARCGCDTRWDAALEIEHTCERCGATWDQDENAADNLLKLYEGGGSIQEVTVVKKDPRWKRLKAEKAAKLEDRGGARKD